MKNNILLPLVFKIKNESSKDETIELFKPDKKSIISTHDILNVTYEEILTHLKNNPINVSKIELISKGFCFYEFPFLIKEEDSNKSVISTPYWGMKPVDSNPCFLLGDGTSPPNDEISKNISWEMITPANAEFSIRVYPKKPLENEI